ncbi:unnamed protein product [Caenorhabditis angaria]|uniref:AMP-dependent synthetase/ligase domain-containing protein n=1 Tax=Caenorhabditis angaria TaxID=860376 RepID=A0A9P1NA41_9PELO|nr:unnamed protein product [Caenorhabditis angaria]
MTDFDIDQYDITVDIEVEVEEEEDQAENQEVQEDPAQEAQEDPAEIPEDHAESESPEDIEKVEEPAVLSDFDCNSVENAEETTIIPIEISNDVEETVIEEVKIEKKGTKIRKVKNRKPKVPKPEEEVEKSVEETEKVEEIFKEPKRKLSKDGELFSRWLFYHLYHHRNLNPSKIALIEEVSEARCVTYQELVDGAIRTANYLHHHGIRNGDRILMSMENSVEYVFYQLAAYMLGAVPVLLNPSLLSSEKFESIDCIAAVVDLENYGHMLRATKSQINNIQHLFILAEELSAIYLPPHLWIYDGFGFLDFPNTFQRCMPMKDGDVTIFSSSDTTSAKSQFIAHTSKSSQILVLNYYEKLFDLVGEDSENTHHLITNGLHCHDCWAYLYFVLAKGETCVLAESTVDVWRASFLDRIAGLIEQYHIPLIISNAQLLKCFIKYEVHNIYDLSSLKIIANTGSTISSTIAKKVKEMLKVTITQAYSAAEFGIVGFEIFSEEDQDHLLSCGKPFPEMKIKVIASIETEKEVETGKWGSIMLNGPNLFRGYCSGSEETNNIKGWFKSGDYGMIDEKNRVHIGGAVGELLHVKNQKLSAELLESVVCEHQLVEDCVVMTNGHELWCGLLLKDENEAPNTSQLDKLFKKNDINANVSKIIILDFIPRSENGKILRNEIPYIMNAEQDEAILVDDTESYI